MKSRKNIGLITLCASMLLVLILDSRTASAGATEGISLCLQTVIPSLFPMMVLSAILTQSLSGRSIPLLKRIQPCISIPEGSEGFFLAGLLGGYPIGARCICQAYQDGKLSKQDAEHMLMFCNNAGPAFIFGICGPFFASPSAPWLLWVIHMISAVMVGIVTQNTPSAKVERVANNSRSLTETLIGCVKTMGGVCGWIVLFRVIIRFLQNWILWILPASIQVFLSGILELTNGCCMLNQIGDPFVRFIVCSVMLAFGGLCVFAQTMTVTTGLSIKKYAKGKLLQMPFSFMLSFIVSQAHPASTVLLFMPPIAVYYLKKVIAFQKQMIYNTGELCKKR